jgi:hypothetical protein
VSKGGSKSTKTTVEPPAWARPLIEGAGNDIMNTVHGNAGNLQGLSNNLTGMLPGLQSMVMDQSTLQPGFNYNQDVLSGKYLGQGNPYLKGMIDQTGQDVGNKVNAQFSAAGRSAGGANQQLLSKGLADSENALRYTDYANERNAMGQASANLAGLNSSRYAGVGSLLNAYNTAGQLPYYGVQAESGLGSLFGGYSQQKQSGGGGGMGSDILGAAMSILPFVL